MVSKKITALAGSGQTQPETSQKDIYPEIIPLDMGAIGGKPAMVTDARNLHKFLGNKDQFATWIKQRVEQYGFSENVDYETYLENSKKGRPRTEYRISSDMAKELSMVERNAQGKMARQYFIDCEERLRRVAPEEHEAALLGWRKNRVAACEDHKSMADAMKGYIERTGDRQHGFAYSNECSFLNSLVLGMHPRVWAKQKEIPVKQVRDHMNADQLALAVIIRHLLTRFSRQDEAKQLLHEQQKSEEALAIKREGDSLVDFCGYLMASVVCDGMLIGNAEIVPFSPRRYLYHAYLAYMRANGLSKPVSLMRFGTDMPGAMAEYGKEYQKRKTKHGIRSNVTLHDDSEDWMPMCTDTTKE